MKFLFHPIGCRKVFFFPWFHDSINWFIARRGAYNSFEGLKKFWTIRTRFFFYPFIDLIFDENSNSIKLDLSQFFFHARPNSKVFPLSLCKHKTGALRVRRSLSGRIIAPEGNHPRAIPCDVLIVIIIYKHYGGCPNGAGYIIYLHRLQV